jgi:hypothetical protein
MVLASPGPLLGEPSCPFVNACYTPRQQNTQGLGLYPSTAKCARFGCTFEVPLALPLCSAPLQEAVAQPSRRPAHQSIVRCPMRLSSRVALAQLVPRCSLSSLASSASSTGMSSSCMHFATLAHLLLSVRSHFHSSISFLSSCNDPHAHCSHARLRSRSVNCRATSSCLRHR